MTVINVDICHNRGLLFFEIIYEVFICLFFGLLKDILSTTHVVHCQMKNCGMIINYSCSLRCGKRLWQKHYPANSISCKQLIIHQIAALQVEV
jgi:hypothetical protein